MLAIHDGRSAFPTKQSILEFSRIRVCFYDPHDYIARVLLTERDSSAFPAADPPKLVVPDYRLFGIRKS